MNFFIPKTRVLGLSVGEDFVILAWVIFTQCQCVTVGQTDIPIVASKGLAAKLTPVKKSEYTSKFCYLEKYVKKLSTSLRT